GGRYRSVRTLHDELRAHAGGVGAVQNVAEGRRYQDVNVERKKLLVGDGLSSGEPHYGALSRHCLSKRGGVEAVSVEDPAVHVAHGHDSRAEVGEVMCGPASHVAEALNGNARSLQRHAKVCDGSLGDYRDTAARCVEPPYGSAE